MKFSDFPYTRPDFDQLELQLQSLVKQFNDAKDGKSQIKVIEKYFELRDEMASNGTIASIRNSVNTKDEFYKEERKIFDERSPLLAQYSNLFNQSMLKSPFRKDLEVKFGTHFFKQVELSLKVFDPKIIPLLIKNNNLSRQYGDLLAAAEIEFEGEIYNLSQMSPFAQHLDREIRHRAQLKVSEFFEKNEKELDQIYDKLVKVRHQMALELGFENFIQVAYYNMGRADYGPEEVNKYRNQIKEVVVPAVSKLNKRKSLRLEIKDLKSYDTISFLSGNPTPKGSKDDLVKAAGEMYKNMSKETDQFFKFMVKHELFDLESKPGKRGGGYCTFIPKYEAPFIFANFNGTSHDVDVLTHEAGHAFQIYSSRHHIPSQRWPGMEAAEINSMSMEFFAWPWIPLFFKEDSEKYYYTHLAGAIRFLPYGALVDEFQHEIYQNPTMTPEQRKDTWRRLEKIYRPDLDYDDDSFLEKGTYWYRQSHIFTAPFYYIDYTLAQICAFQYWIKNKADHKKAWESYYHLSTLGGSLGFIGLLKEAGLDSPFEEDSIKKVLKPLMEFLDSIDDTKL